MFDTEQIIDKIITFLKAKLPTAIADMNAKKNDSVTLEKPVDAAYLFQYLEDAALNQPVFVIVGEQEPETQHLASSFKERSEIFIVIGAAYNAAEDINTLPRKLLRYRRALMNVLTDNYMNIVPQMTFEIKPGPPQGFKTDNDEEVGIIGITLQPNKGV